MKKEFLLNIILLLAINFLIKPLYIFGVDLQIQNAVGESTYGMYKVLFSIAFLLQFVHEPGIQAYNSQNIAKNPDTLGFHLGHILGLKIILGMIFFSASIGIFLMGPYDKSLLPLMTIITVNAFLSTLFLYFRTNIAAIGKYRIDSLMSSLDKLIMLLILGFLVWNPSTKSHFDIIWLAWGQFCAFVISCLVALWILYRHLGHIQIAFSWAYTKKLLRQSLPFALILLTMSAYSRMDTIMIERILDDDGYQSGIYEYGYRFLDALNMVGYMFASLLVPMYASNIKKHHIIHDLLDMGLRLMAIIAVLGASVFITYRHEIISIAKGSPSPYISHLLIYLVLSFVCISIAYLFGSLLVANHTIKKYNILLIGGVILNFVLNFYFIHSQKALGAAKATLITQAVMTLGQIYLVYKIVKVRPNLFLIVKVIVFSILCGLVFAGIYRYFSWNWIYKSLLSILSGLILALVLNVFDVQLAREIINKKLKKA